MAEIDRIDKPDYEAPDYKDPSEDMTDRMTGIRKRFARAEALDSDCRTQGLEDYRFAWVQGSQWDTALSMRRGRRPKYEFNKLGQAIKQVINNNRQNTPSIKVRANKESSRDLADIRQGLMRNIESMSHADTVYDWGAMFAITSGFGAWEVTADYVDSESFEQDLQIVAIQNPLTSVFFGPAKLMDRRDAPYAFVIEDYTWEAYADRWPDSDYVSFTGVAMDPCGDWYTKDTVRVAKYWYKESKEETIYQLDDGRVVRADEWDKEDDGLNALSPSMTPGGDVSDAPTPNGQASPQDPTSAQQPSDPEDSYGEPIISPASIAKLVSQLPKPPKPKIIKTRKVKREVVKYEIVSGLEVLEGPFEWAGKFIPIIPVWGNLINDNGIDSWFGMVRWSADAQRLYNYNRSNSVEVMANQSRVPFMYTPKMVEGFENEWSNMAVSNAPGLPFNPDPSVAGGRPSREPPPQFPAGMLEASNVDDADIKATTGIFQASLGQPSNETSGKAIQARSHQGNVATFDYQDNIAKAVQFTGEIIDDLIPYYYDTYRELRILGADGAEKYVEVNKPIWNAKTLKWEKENDLSQGKYDVTVTVGPSFATQRMETLDAMLQLAQAGGPTAMLFQYAAIKNMDVPGMQEVEEAVRRMLVEMKILEPDANDPPPAPAPPAPPTPKEQADMMKAQAQVQTSQAQATKYGADTQLVQAKTQRTQVETRQMVEHAVPDLVAAHAASTSAAAGAGNDLIDAAWKNAHNEARYDQFNGQPLTNLDQATLPNVTTPPNPGQY